jgi:hypothetical protein
MQEIWFNGTKDKEKVKQDIALAHNAFKRLTDILNKRLKTDKVSDYDKASWPFYQADNNGYNRALQEVLKLIKGD